MFHALGFEVKNSKFFYISFRICIIILNVDFKQKWKGGQSSTYLRQMRALSGPWVSVAKIYRDETK